MIVKELILHCSATKEGKDYKASDVKRWHLQRGFVDIGYHYVIDLDGTVEKGRKDNAIGAHCLGHNSKSLGICYIGGLDEKGKPKDTRTEEQKKAMYELVQQLLKKYNLKITDVHGHYEFANKACPCFKIEQFRKEYQEWLDAQ